MLRRFKIFWWVMGIVLIVNFLRILFLRVVVVINKFKQTVNTKKPIVNHYWLFKVLVVATV